MAKDDDRKGPKPAWRKPELRGLETGAPPHCNPAFPQAQICATNGLPQSSVGCNQKGTFS